VSTASTVRGVREGATTFGRTVGSEGATRARLEQRLAQLEALAAESAYPPLVPDDDDTEVDDDADWDGDDGLDGVERFDRGSSDAAERPRIRPRPRSGA
jgi:hypothetical protein